MTTCICSGPRLVNYQVTRSQRGPLRIILGFRPQCGRTRPSAVPPRSPSFVVMLVSRAPLYAITSQPSPLPTFRGRGKVLTTRLFITREVKASSARARLNRYLSPDLQVVVRKLTRKRHGRGLVHLVAVLLEQLLVDLGGGRRKGGRGDELLQCEVRITRSN